MKLSFHGAARGVTGSCHMVECAGRKILIDCGMFQGSQELNEENSAAFGFDPADVDVLLLTHAHLDHCGRIPLLVKRGFRGEIIATAATRDLARIILLDSAHLHEEEASRRKRHGNHSAGREALYDTIDALDALDQFGRVAVYEKPIELFSGITASFHDAGHILGSASILLDLNEGGEQRKVLFSGDLGPYERPLLNDPAPPRGADVVVMETTYGDRDHRPLAPSVDELFATIRTTLRRGGNVVMPTFALERAQELLYFLRSGVADGVLPATMDVYLDSPMAISATKVFSRHPEALRPEIIDMILSGEDPFGLPGLHMVREASDSAALNHIHSGAVIMAGSGMATGGRVRHHLRHNLAHSHSSIIFIGFAAEGTLARIIIDGARQVELFGKSVPVNASVHTINGFSAHAGQSDLKRWHDSAGRPARTFLVHGEEKPMKAFAATLRGTRVETPQMHQSFAI